MRKLLLLLGISISFLSCESASRVPEFSSDCAFGRGAELYLSDICEGDFNLVVIYKEELERLGGIMSDYSPDECVFVTVNSSEGSAIEGYLKAKEINSECRI